MNRRWLYQLSSTTSRTLVVAAKRESACAPAGCTPRTWEDVRRGVTRRHPADARGARPPAGAREPRGLLDPTVPPEGCADPPAHLRERPTEPRRHLAVVALRPSASAWKCLGRRRPLPPPPRWPHRPSAPPP